MLDTHLALESRFVDPYSSPAFEPKQDRLAHARLLPQLTQVRNEEPPARLLSDSLMVV